MGYQTIVREGKTKLVKPIFDKGAPTGFVEIIHKDDITAGNGKRHDVIEHKGELVNEMSCNIFELLKQRGIRVAYQQKLTPNSSLNLGCAMLKAEVVVRAFAEGSVVPREKVPFGHQFQPPRVEFYYKTTNRQRPVFEKDARKRVHRWITLPLPEDDPLIRFVGDSAITLLHPKTGEEIMTHGSEQVALFIEHCRAVEPDALRAFSVLAHACRDHHAKLSDVKFEFGQGADGNFYLADSCSADEFRIWKNGKELSKEPYRRGASTKETLEIYKDTARLTRKFVKH